MDPPLFLTLWQRFKTDPLVYSCRQMILQHVFKHGMVFYQNKKKIELDETQQALVDDYWRPFAYDVYDSIVCHGFVCIEICEDEFGHKFPALRRPGTYRLVVEFIDSQVTLSARALTGNTTLENVFFMSNFGFEVLRDGTFTSQMMKILPRLGFLRELRKTAIDLEYSRVAPTHFSEIPAESTTEKEGVNFDWFVEGSSTEMDQNMKFTRNQMEIDQLRQQEELYEQHRGSTRKTQTALKNIVQLPMGHRLRPVASQPGRHDLVTIKKIIQEEICTCLGVPRALMISDSIYRSSTEGINDAFKHTLLWWKNTISTVLTECWMRVHVDEVAKKVKKKESIFALKRLHRVQISFPVAPYATNETLQWLYETGVIDWDTFVIYALRNNNFPVEKRKRPRVDRAEEDEVMEAKKQKLDTDVKPTN